jgi:hypothetical protein
LLPVEVVVPVVGFNEMVYKPIHPPVEQQVLLLVVEVVESMVAEVAEVLVKDAMDAVMAEEVEEDSVVELVVLEAIL